MSSRSALFACFTLAGCVTGSLTGCLKPEDRFDEFESRVVDAGPGGNLCVSQPVDISGEFLLAIAVSFAPTTPLQFRCQSTLVANTSLDLQCTPLTYDERTDDDAGEELGQDDIPVEFDGSFIATINGTVPGTSNPISHSNIVTGEGGLVLSGVSCSADDFCGTVAGAIVEPFEDSNIMGTFGAVRITAGAEGDALPEAAATCP